MRPPLAAALLLLLLLLATAGCRSAPSVVSPPAPPQPLHHVTAAECGACHEAILREWQGSQHAQANPLKDPIHGAMYRRMVGDPTREGVTEAGGPPHCPACHVAAAAVDGTTKLDAEPVYLEGVTCTTCHTLTGRAAGETRGGIHAYTRSPDHLQGPRFAGRSAARFPMERRGAFLGSPEMCLGCHGLHTNAQGVAICRTGDEASPAGGGAPCQACHMAVRDGHADHTMAGGHAVAMVARAATVEVSAVRDGSGVEARVVLRSRISHAFPTGAPFRMGLVEVTGFDGTGGEVVRRGAGEGEADGRLMVHFTDDGGRPVAAVRATRIARDSRLAGGEVRELTYHLPRAVARVRARLLYRLLPPPLAAQLGEVAAADPKVVAEAEAVVE